MVVLDLFCGLGGWSRPWREAGHHVVTLDIAPRFGADLTMDVRDFLDANRCRGDHHWALRPDVILASPPCEEFSRWSMRGMSRYLQTHPPPPPSTELVRETMRVINTLEPAYWVLENVHGSAQFINPVVGRHHYRGVYAGRYLWGTFPDLGPLPRPPVGVHRSGESAGLRPKSSYASRDRDKRAEIPAALAQAVMRACVAEHEGGMRWVQTA